MKYNPGDTVRIVCDVDGVILEDPTKSEYSVIVKFGDCLTRMPIDGSLFNCKHIRLQKVESETYEHP